MDIPQKIRDKIAEIFRKKQESEEKDRKLCEAEEKRLAKINVLRESQRPELETKAKMIADFLYELWQSVEIKKIFQLRKKIIVFGACFHCGEPCPSDHHAWAVIGIERDGGRVFYSERYNMSMGSAELGRKEFGNLGNIFYHAAAAEALAKELVDGLHPDYISQFAEGIASGKVWDIIERSLR